MKPLETFSWLIRRPIAHRGLHDGNASVCENSPSAFRAAVEHGLSIECDVRLSGDGVPMVFHDDTLERLTGEAGRISDRTAADLARLRLCGTDDEIPTLADMLGLVAGRVPIVAELKGRSPSEDEGFVDRLRPLVERYDGPLALMSFDRWLIEQMDSLAAHIPVGLTAEGLRPEMLAAHRDILAARGAFVSYNVHHLPNAFVDWARRERGLPVISWTVRSPDDARLSALHCDQMTFEGFLPQA